VIRPVHSALPTSCGVPAHARPQEPYYAPPISSVPPARGDFSRQSSRLGPSQSQQPRPPRGCFECDDTRYFVRDCPILRRGGPPQISHTTRAPPGPQAMILAPSHPTRSGGRGGQGCPRGGGQARYFALPARTEAVPSDFVIIGIFPV